MNSDEPKTILIVEDEAIISIVTSKSVKRFGYNVICANSGERAVELAAENEAISLILMDIELGTGIDGTVAAQRILAIRDIPIVFHTSHSERDMVERVRGITRYGYVIKSSGDFVLQSSIEMAYELVEAKKKVKSSEEHFFSLFEKAPLGYQSLDENGYFLEVNQSWLDTLGYSREEVTGKWFGDFLAPEFTDAFRERFPIFKAAGKIHSEFQMMHKNGERRYIAFEGRIGYKDDGSFMQTHCILSDITERKIVEDALLKSEHELKLILKKMINGFVSYESVFNDKGEFVSFRYLYINDAYERITGIKNEHVQGKTVHEVFPDVEESWIIKFREVALTGEPVSFEMFNVSTNKIYYCNVYQPEESNKRLCVILEDITDRKKNEEEIKFKNEELTALNEELNAAVEEMEAANEELNAAMEEMEAANEELIAANERLIESEHEIERSEEKFRQMFFQHQAIMLLIDPVSGCIVDANTSAEKFYGYEIDQFRKMKIQDINTLSPEEIDAEIKHVKEKEINHFIFPHRLANSEIRTVEVYSSPVTINGNILLFSIIHDITPRRLTEEKFRRSEERYSMALAAVDDGIWEWNEADANGYLSPQYYRMLGYADNEFPACYDSWRALVHPEDIDRVERELGFSVDRGEKFNIDLRMKMKSGEWLWACIRGKAVEWNAEGKAVRMVGTLSDVTLRKYTEMELRESQVNLEKIIENSSDLICELDENGKYTFVSERYKALLGYSPGELLGRHAVEKMHPDDIENAKAKFIRLKSDTGVSVDEWRFLHKNGIYHSFECRSSVYIYRDGRPRMVVISHDITEAKRIEEVQSFLLGSGPALPEKGDFFQSLARYIAGNLEADYVCIDRLTGYGLSARTLAVFTDGGFEDNIEYTLKDTPCGEVAGKTICTFRENVRGLFPEDAVLQEMNAESYAGVTLWSSTGEPIGLIAVIWRKKMENIYIAESVLKMVAVRAAGELERRDAEEKIRNLLKEKELLLREVHHRIKNNMNTMYGLLSLQAEAMEVPAAAAALNDAVARIQSMMVLYDKLYRSDAFKELSVKDYLPALIGEVVRSFPQSNIIRIEKRIDDFVMDVKTLVPLGIIVNELLTNTMKYAFKGMDSGFISVSVSKKDNRASLVLADNGIGIPESVSFENSTGFGMQLVSMLTEQIGGRISIERGDGTKFILEFDL
jgi:PAS domain S-box-containing protein